jgi:hypothetical protein
VDGKFLKKAGFINKAMLRMVYFKQMHLGCAQRVNMTLPDFALIHCTEDLTIPGIFICSNVLTQKPVQALLSGIA